MAEASIWADPHIKVLGKADAVANAKDRIMSVLDTKSNRVTLKMDVSHTDHSHVIGKGGNNIKKVMQDTGCHIHFPDSNRGNTIEKSNQVSIAGQPEGTDRARQSIRNLLPLVFMFELPITGVLQPVPDASSPPILQIQHSYNVTVTFKQRPRMYVTTVIVRGSVREAKTVKEGTAALIEHLTGNVGASLPVSTQIEIAPQHHLFMIGRGGINIKQIMQRTGANIHFPDPNNVTPQRKGTVYITGGIESVYLARLQIIGCLPLVLMFDMKEDIDIDQGGVSQLMEQLDVFISVKPKPKQPSKSVIVKSIERNAANMFTARRRLLGQDLERPLERPPISSRPSSSSIVSPPPTQDNSSNNASSLGLAQLGMLGHNLLSITTSNLLMLNGLRSPTLNSPHSTGTNSSTGSLSPSHIIPQQTGLYPPATTMLLTAAGQPPQPPPPPPPGYSVQSTFDLYSQCNGFSKDLNQNTAFVRVPTPSDRGASSNNSNTTSPEHSPTCNSPIDLITKGHGMKHTTLNSPTNGQDELEVHSMRYGSRLVDVVLQKKQSPSNSGNAADLLGLTKPPGSPIISNHAVLLEENVRNVSFMNGGRRSSESGSESDHSDPRAPGSNRPSPSNSFNSPHSLFANNGPPTFNFDYEQKKLLATKAMQKKPVGESRIPTDYWAGLGFSKSMPGSAIRDGLKQNNVHRYQEPSMSTTYEDNDEEIDHDPWKDSPNMGRSGNPPTNPAPGEYPSLRRKYDQHGLSNHVESSTMPKPSSAWAPKTDLAELFSKLGLGKYTDLFQQQEIDLATFLTLTDVDLKELGISTFGARRKMLLAIADLNKRPSLIAAAQVVNNNPFRDSGASAMTAAAKRRPDIVSQSGRW